jgi:hypothetical protein
LKLLSLVLDSLLVGLSFSKLLLQGINLFIDLSDLLNDDLKFFGLGICSGLSLISGVFEGLYFLENGIVSNNVYNP